MLRQIFMGLKPNFFFCIEFHFYMQTWLMTVTFGTESSWYINVHLKKPTTLSNHSSSSYMLNWTSIGRNVSWFYITVWQWSKMTNLFNNLKHILKYSVYLFVIWLVVATKSIFQLCCLCYRVLYILGWDLLTDEKKKCSFTLYSALLIHAYDDGGCYVDH